MPQTAFGRIALAIAVSLLVHALMLFVPLAPLPPQELPLPPLTAKLEPLPVIAAAPKPKRAPAKPRPKPAKVPVAAPLTEPVPDTTQPPETPASPELAETPEPKTASEPEQAVEQPVVVEPAKPVHPLPKHAQLTFIAFQGTSFEIGEVRHRLELRANNRYSITVNMNTTGIAGVFKRYESMQLSSGTMTPQGLRPNSFTEVRVTSSGRENFSANFDWEAKIISFIDDTQAALPEQAQDMVSILYQLSQLPLDQRVFPMSMSNGRKLEHYELEIGEEEVVETRMGKLRGLPLRKVHGPGEEGLDIWLGLEYRMLPIMVRQIDRNGNIAGELRISDIRVADE